MTGEAGKGRDKWDDADKPEPDSNRNYGPTGAGGQQAKLRFVLQPFDQIIPDSTPPFLVRDIIPHRGLVVIWGPPKCGKTFFALDLVMHIALGREYRGKRVKQGGVVYSAFEGGDGIKRRIAAFREQRLAPHTGDCPFWLMSGSLALARDHIQLIADIRVQIGDAPPPACVVLDTLNRSLAGSESSDEDMSSYIQAADAIREAFGAAVIVVHHCGLNDTRPRGHTSLTGAVDAQVACKKLDSGASEIEVEYMKDGPADCKLRFKLEQVTIGIDDNGDPMTSCVVVPVGTGETPEARKRKAMSVAQRVAFDALADGIALFGKPVPSASGVPEGVVLGITVDEWAERAFQRGLSTSDKPDARRKAFKRALEALVAGHYVGVWHPYAWLPRRPP